jgi:hypothetical protein
MGRRYRVCVFNPTLDWGFAAVLRRLPSSLLVRTPLPYLYRYTESGITLFQPSFISKFSNIARCLCNFLCTNMFAFIHNVKLSLCLTKHHAMKTYWGSGVIVPRIL